MKKIFYKIPQSFILFFLVLFFFEFSCKRANMTPINPITKTVDLRDTLANYALESYYWNSLIPSSFNPHSYSAVDTFFSETQAIKSYSANDPGTRTNLDRFSFVLTENDYQTEFVQGSSLGYGMYFRFDPSGIYRVRYVAHASQAYAQGVRRGWEIDSVNGIVPVNSSAFLVQVGNALGKSSVVFSFRDPNGAKHTITLNSATILDDEVVTTKVLDTGGKKIGYLVYNTFLPKSGPKDLHPGLDTAFAGLAARNITDLVIDLRYNGGGYVQVAEEMDNALIPASYQGKLMFTETFNKLLSGYNTSTFINKNKSTNPTNLNPNSVTFIVSEGTASASELTINNLFPFFPSVKIIGVSKGRAVSQKTAGKPFGFFNYSFPSSSPQYEAFLINDETKNSLGQDNYTSGFTPDIQVNDGVAYDWGDLRENGYAEAVHYLVSGSLSDSYPFNTLSTSKPNNSGYIILDDNGLPGRKISGQFHSQSLKRK